MDDGLGWIAENLTQHPRRLKKLIQQTEALNAIQDSVLNGQLSNPEDIDVWRQIQGEFISREQQNLDMDGWQLLCVVRRVEKKIQEKKDKRDKERKALMISEVDNDDQDEEGDDEDNARASNRRRTLSNLSQLSVQQQQKQSQQIVIDLTQQVAKQREVEKGYRQQNIEQAVTIIPSSEFEAHSLPKLQIKRKQQQNGNNNIQQENVDGGDKHKHIVIPYDNDGYSDLNERESFRRNISHSEQYDNDDIGYPPVASSNTNNLTMRSNAYAEDSIDQKPGNRQQQGIDPRNNIKDKGVFFNTINQERQQHHQSQIDEKNDRSLRLPLPLKESKSYLDEDTFKKMDQQQATKNELQNIQNRFNSSNINSNRQQQQYGKINSGGQQDDNDQRLQRLLALHTTGGNNLRQQPQQQYQQQQELPIQTKKEKIITIDNAIPQRPSASFFVSPSRQEYINNTNNSNSYKPFGSQENWKPKDPRNDMDIQGVVARNNNDNRYKNNSISRSRSPRLQPPPPPLAAGLHNRPNNIYHKRSPLQQFSQIDPATQRSWNPHPSVSPQPYQQYQSPQHQQPLKPSPITLLNRSPLRRSESPSQQPLALRQARRYQSHSSSQPRQQRENSLMRRKRNNIQATEAESKHKRYESPQSSDKEGRTSPMYDPPPQQNLERMSLERETRIEQMQSPYAPVVGAYGGSRREDEQYQYHTHSPGPANYGGRRVGEGQQQHNQREMFSFQQKIRRSVSRSLSKERRIIRKDSDSSPYQQRRRLSWQLEKNRQLEEGEQVEEEEVENKSNQYKRAVSPYSDRRPQWNQNQQGQFNRRTTNRRSNSPKDNRSRSNSRKKQSFSRSNSPKGGPQKINYLKLREKRPNNNNNNNNRVPLWRDKQNYKQNNYDNRFQKQQENKQQSRNSSNSSSSSSNNQVMKSNNKYDKQQGQQQVEQQRNETVSQQDINIKSERKAQNMMMNDDTLTPIKSQRNIIPIHTYIQQDQQVEIQKKKQSEDTDNAVEIESTPERTRNSLEDEEDNQQDQEEGGGKERQRDNNSESERQNKKGNDNDEEWIEHSENDDDTKNNKKEKVNQRGQRVDVSDLSDDDDSIDQNHNQTNNISSNNDNNNNHIEKDNHKMNGSDSEDNHNDIRKRSISDDNEDIYGDDRHIDRLDEDDKLSDSQVSQENNRDKDICIEKDIEGVHDVTHEETNHKNNQELHQSIRQMDNDDNNNNRRISIQEDNNHSDNNRRSRSASEQRSNSSSHIDNNDNNDNARMMNAGNEILSGQRFQQQLDQIQLENEEQPANKEEKGEEEEEQQNNNMIEEEQNVEQIIEPVKEKVNVMPLADTTLVEKDKSIGNDPISIIPAVSAISPIVSSSVQPKILSAFTPVLPGQYQNILKKTIVGSGPLPGRPAALYGNKLAPNYSIPRSIFNPPPPPPFTASTTNRATTALTQNSAANASQQEQDQEKEQKQ